MLILLGRSCSGKTKIQKELVKLGISPVVAYTTRPARYGEEKEGVYKFISEDEFFHLKNVGFFLQTISHQVADHITWHYATALCDIEENTVMIGNPKSVRYLNQLEGVHPFSVYIDTDENLIYDRLIQRKDDIFEAQRRIIADRQEFANIYNLADYTIENSGLHKPEELAVTIKQVYEDYMDSVHRWDAVEGL